MKTIIKLLVVAVVLVAGLFMLTNSTIYAQYQIEGSWRDSSGTTGYEFKDDNVCTVTLMDVTIPIINYNFDGSLDGIYSIEKGEDGNMYVTISYTVPVVSYTVELEYIFEVDGSTLTLTDPDSGSSTVYIEYEEVTQAS